MEKYFMGDSEIPNSADSCQKICQVYIPPRGYIFSFNLIFEFYDYTFLLLQSNMHMFQPKRVSMGLTTRQ